LTCISLGLAGEGGYLWRKEGVGGHFSANIGWVLQTLLRVDPDKDHVKSKLRG